MPYKSAEQLNTVILSRKLLETHLRLPKPQPGVGHRKEQTSPSPEPHGASRWQLAFAHTSPQGKLCFPGGNAQLFWAIFLEKQAQGFILFKETIHRALYMGN